MKFLLTLALAILCVIVGHTCADEIPTISVSDSYVPNDVFNVDSVETYLEAWALYRNDTKKRVESFSSLYQLKHPVNGGWTVAEGCSTIYVPGGAYNYVNLDVKYNDTTTLVQIFCYYL